MEIPGTINTIEQLKQQVGAEIVEGDVVEVERLLQMCANHFQIALHVAASSMGNRPCIVEQACEGPRCKKSVELRRYPGEGGHTYAVKLTVMGRGGCRDRISAGHMLHPRQATKFPRGRG